MNWHGLRLAAGLLMILLLVVATGCATSSGVTSNYCLIATPISYSVLDTPETVAQIERHNSDWSCTCAEDCK